MALLSVLILGSAVKAAAIGGLAPLGKLANSADTCSCKTWKEVYAEGLVTCGHGNEYRVLVPQFKNPSEQQFIHALWGEKLCDNFFTKMGGSACTNLKTGMDKGQWCYVSSECDKLRGGEVVPNATNLAWKRCTSSDDLFKDWDMEKLNKFADEYDLDLALLTKMALPLEGHLWSAVGSFWENPEEAAKTLPSGVRKYFQRIVDSGRTVTFDTDKDHLPPHVVVTGKKVYWVESTGLNETGVPPPKKKELFKMRCSANCAK